MTIHEIPRSQLLFKSAIYVKIFYPVYQFLWEAFVTRGQIYDPKGPEQMEIAVKQFRRRMRFSGYEGLAVAGFFNIMAVMMFANESTFPVGIAFLGLGIYSAYAASELIRFEHDQELIDKVNEQGDEIKNNRNEISELKKRINEIEKPRGSFYN